MNGFRCPKVAIVIPAYNQGKYLKRAATSALKQEGCRCEVYIVDDCSTDDTPVICQRLREQYKNLQVIHHETNLGLGKNVDFCLRLPKEEFILRLDSDDILEPTFAVEALKVMEAHPQAGYVHVLTQTINLDDTLGSKRILNRRKVYYSPEEALMRALSGYRVSANILMFRRTALEQVNYSDISLSFAEDYDLTVRIANQGWGNAYIPKRLALYRQWPNSGNNRARRKLSEIEGLTHVFTHSLPSGFKRHNLPEAKLRSARSKMARNQAAYTPWPLFSKGEKKELWAALSALSGQSSMPIFKFFIHIGGNKMTKVFLRYKLKIKTLLKNF
ncbi:MAG: glycosyltransferase family 2 protein [Verrucomicrobiota bacterium]